MIIGIGTDIVEVKRIAKAAEEYGDRFMNRIFTINEKEYCEQHQPTKMLHYAARFAYKEAFSKAIGTGITKGFQFKDCGLKNLPTGQPVADLSGVIAERWGCYKIHISLSHTDEYAVAMVVVEDLS